jgi:DegV family protein with EDD domain
VATPDDSWESTDSHDFYEQMRQGACPTIAQVTAQTFTQLFSQAVAAGKDVLYIGFSSALSGTLNAATLARAAVVRSYPEANICIVDSLCASMGLGLLVLAAARRLQAGAGAQETAAWVESVKLQVNHWFTVGDLEYLRRGGRISNLASAMGSLLQIKPVLRVDEAGRLVPYNKVRGRRKAIEELCRQLNERIVDPEGQTIAISHGDCPTNAQELASRILSRLPVGECIIHPCGSAVGAHSGPETLAVFFWGQHRR